MVTKEVVNELLDYVRNELSTREEQGCDVKALREKLEKIPLEPPDVAYEQLDALYREAETLTPTEDFPYREPSDLSEIRAERPPAPRDYRDRLSEKDLEDKIHGAWLGRIAGCILAKPVEGWSRQQIEHYLNFYDAYPLTDFIPYEEGVVPEGERKPGLLDCTRGRIERGARDDDTDYTVLGLTILENHGLDFTSRLVANRWMVHMPYHMVYTAERCAYRNFVNNIFPPDSASVRNPYREWIGAQIRADAWGYVSPGMPERAAEFAYRDASVSHVKNGIYGEMWVAAAIAAAFVEKDVRRVLEMSLAEIPHNCRLAEALRDVLDWTMEDPDWQTTWDRMHEKYGHYHVVHTINNAVVVALSLLHGNSDFGKTICIATMCGLDTDCNGATAGSIAGTILGAHRLPERWHRPLHDRLDTSLSFVSECRISDLAERTLKIAKKNLEKN
jgi:ADP-ribosylglycohydrolase